MRSLIFCMEIMTGGTSVSGDALELQIGTWLPLLHRSGNYPQSSVEVRYVPSRRSVCTVRTLDIDYERSLSVVRPKIGV